MYFLLFGYNYDEFSEMEGGAIKRSSFVASDREVMTRPVLGLCASHLVYLWLFVMKLNRTMSK